MMQENREAETGIRSVLRNGSWVSGSRMRLWAGAFLVGFVAAVAWLISSSHGLNDAFGRPLGTDFSCLYAAGQLAAAHLPADAYDFVRETAKLRSIFGAGAPFYGWFYPPFFLIPAEAAGRLPYPAALALWLAAGLVLYLAALARLKRACPPLQGNRLWLLMAIAFPAVFVNLTHGQNGFLTAAFFAAALTWLDEKPWLAGLCFGLVCYKPQFALLIPFALAVGKHWKALAGFAFTLIALAAAATAAYGMSVWQAFFASTRFSREIVLEQGAPGFEKIQSVFAALRHLGASVDVAYACQGAASLAVLVLVLSLWRKPTIRPALKGAALCLGTLLVTPYVLDYDFMLLAPAILLLAADGRARGYRPYEKSLLALLWLVPILARTVAGAIYLPLGLIVVAGTFALCVGKARAIVSDLPPRQPVE